jgi:hypothetical protein
MSIHDEHIKRIEEKLSKLLSRLKELEKENERLQKELLNKNVICEDLRKKADQLELGINLHKASESQDAQISRNALDKKINEYIKEIDRCIALLGDQD